MLLGAVSTPVLTGIFAVAGALVGALAGSLPEAYFTSRRERALAKAGARLVAADIAIADSQLQGAEKDERWWRFHKLEMANWDEYRNVLAIRLSHDAFEAVSQSAMGLRYFGENMQDAPGFQNPDTGSVSINAKTLKPQRHDAAKAYNALADLAGYERVGDLIHPPEETSRS